MAAEAVTAWIEGNGGTPTPELVRQRQFYHHCGSVMIAMEDYFSQHEDVAITAGNSNTLYAVITIWLVKTTEGGTWSPADSGLTSVGSPLAIDLQNTSTIFATGCTTANSICGVVKSADGGASWSVGQILQDPESNWVTTLTIDPQNSNIVYATTQGFDECGEETLYKSVDGGMGWSHSLFNSMGVSTGCVLALAVDPQNSNNLYAAFQYGGVFKSTDAGATWRAANPGLFANNAVALAIDPSGPGTVYTVSSAGVFKSGWSNKLESCELRVTGLVRLNGGLLFSPTSGR